MIDGKGISRIGDSVFSINITVELLIQTLAKTLSALSVIDIIRINIRIQNDLKHI
jgi:hypothetical protein